MLNKKLEIVRLTKYSCPVILGEPASFVDYLTIDQISGKVTVTHPIEDNNITSFLLIIEVMRTQN